MSLADYDERTAWKYLEIPDRFPTSPGLDRKVDPKSGKLKPFPGTTVVFRPEKFCSNVVRIMREALQSMLRGTGILASPLPLSTIHMTLHDMVSQDTCPFSPEDIRFSHTVTESLRDAWEITEEVRRDFRGQSIAFTADRIVPMVSTSLVLLLRPVNDEDEALIREIHHRFDRVQPLPYPLTPHITLAYFRPGMVNGEKLRNVLEAAQIPPEHPMEFEFHPEAITGQVFRDMGTYMDIPERICFCCDGGLNRSVMAAGILNHLARERNLPVTGEARAACHGTEGRPIPEKVRRILARHGMAIPGDEPCARYLESTERTHFTCFAELSEGAAVRIGHLSLSGERVVDRRCFQGIRDPEYGEATHEQVFQELRKRTEKYLRDFEERYRNGILF